jgi:hypothetical protein
MSLVSAAMLGNNVKQKTGHAKAFTQQRETRQYVHRN